MTEAEQIKKLEVECTKSIAVLIEEVSGGYLIRGIIKYYSDDDLLVAERPIFAVADTHSIAVIKAHCFLRESSFTPKDHELPFSNRAAQRREQERAFEMQSILKAVGSAEYTPAMSQEADPTFDDTKLPPPPNTLYKPQGFA